MTAIAIAGSQVVPVYQDSECGELGPVALITRPVSFTPSPIDGAIYTARLRIKASDLKVNGIPYALPVRSAGSSDTARSRTWILDFCQYRPIVIGFPASVDAFLDGTDWGIDPVAAQLECTVMPGDVSRSLLAHASRTYSYTQALKASAGSRTLTVPTGAVSASWVGPVGAPSLACEIGWGGQSVRVDLDRDALPGVCGSDEIEVTPIADGFLRWEIELP